MTTLGGVVASLDGVRASPGRVKQLLGDDAVLSPLCAPRCLNRSGNGVQFRRRDLTRLLGVVSPERGQLKRCGWRPSTRLVSISEG